MKEKPNKPLDRNPASRDNRRTTPPALDNPDNRDNRTSRGNMSPIKKKTKSKGK